MTGAAVRQPLPDRRPSVVIEAMHSSLPMTLTVGLRPGTGQPAEVFVNLPKAGSDLAHLLADACVVISLALQAGYRPAELGKSLGVVPDPVGPEGAVKPASAIGVICDVLARGDM
jgi:hypothetical protein